MALVNNGGNTVTAIVTPPVTQTVAISQTGTDNDVEVINGPGAAAVNIQDGGNSITVDGPLTDAELRASPVDVNVTNTITISEPVSVDDNGGSLTIDGTVAVSNFPALQAVSISQSGTDNNVDANVTNGAGAAAVNIQDGGNSITVDGTVAATQSGAWTVTANAGTGIFSVREATNATSTRTDVARSNASQTLLASNTNRKGASIYNDAAANLFVRLGTAAATTTDFSVRLQSQDYYEIPFHYTGQVTGVWQSNGAGNALMTEIT